MLFFLVESETRILSFAPTSGPVGTELRIFGTGLGGGTGAAVGDVPLTGFTVISDNEVRGTIAAGTTNGLVTITTLGGTATSTAEFVLFTGGGTSYTAENARDDVGAALVAGNTASNAITFTLDDPNNTIKGDLPTGGTSTKLLYWNTATTKWEPCTLDTTLLLTGGVLGAVVGSGGGTGGSRLTDKNLLTWTASHPPGQTYTYFNRPPLQDLTKLTDGFGGSNSITTPGTDGLLVSGKNFVQVLATFSSPVFLNEVRYYSGQFNGATLNPATIIKIYRNTALLATFCPNATAATQTFDLLANTNFNQASNQFIFEFWNVATSIPVMELGLYGAIQV